MDEITSKIYFKVFFFILSLFIVLLAFYLVKPFLPAVFAGGIIAYLSYPVYTMTLRYLKNKHFTSLIIAVFIVLLLTVPFVIVLGLVSKEAYKTYISLSKQNLGTNFMNAICQDDGSLFCKAFKSLIRLLPEDNLDYYLQTTIEKIIDFLLENISKFLVSIPLIFLNFFVMIFVVYYLLKDGEAITKRIKHVLPLKESHKERVIDRFHSITYAIFYGNISIAILQGILGVIGFLILGVQSPFLWGFVMMLFALLPYLGTAIIWLPAALDLIFIGYLQNSNSYIIRGTILIAYGIFVISMVDNFLKPKIIGDKARIHPILVLLGVLGGLRMFGFIGLILGPLILALLITFVDIYKDEFL